MADDVLHSGVGGVRELMVMPGLINLDFADIRTVMEERAKARMGTGEAEGDRRANDGAEAAISNPLLEDVSMKGARGVLINITGGTDMTLFEVDEAANRIREEVDPDANIIFGSTFDEKLAGRMRISVVATGIEAVELAQDQGRLGLVARIPDGGPGLRDSGSGYTQPLLTQNAASASPRRARLCRRLIARPHGRRRPQRAWPSRGSRRSILRRGRGRARKTTCSISPPFCVARQTNSAGLTPAVSATAPRSGR